MNSLLNKVALITGGSSGIGLAAAKLFTEAGATVHVTGRNADNLAEAKASLPSLRVHQSDTADLASTKAVLKAIQEENGRLDVLFVNAGVFQPVPFGQVPEKIFDQTMNINFKGAFFLLQEAIPMLSEGGSIVLNATVNAKRAPDVGVLYGSSKAAFLSLTRFLPHTNSIKAKRIRVNAVSPGPIETPIYAKSGIPEDQLTQFAQALAGGTALGRFGQDVEIAKAALFLASDDASYITGAELVADGGLSQRFL